MKIARNNLYIVSTPIGNLDDITFRAIEVLKKSDFILCEDTRHSLKLLNHFKIKKKLISYHKFNEKKKISSIIEQLNMGKILSLVSDAGTPLISDPGRLLINECLKNDIQITPIPGVSSIIAATSVSGFSDQFLFYGFLPKKEKELERSLNSLSSCKYAIVAFIPSNRINYYLDKIKKYFSGRKLMIAREITKIHESFYRYEVKELKLFKNPLKGELTLVISEKKYTEKSFDKDEITKKIKKYLKKYSLKDTVNLILENNNINKKKIYQLCLNIKNEKSN